MNMKIKFTGRCLALALCLGLLACGPALAQKSAVSNTGTASSDLSSFPSVITGRDAGLLNTMAGFFGNSELDIDDWGDPLILANIGNFNYAIQFYGCENGTACTEMQFVTWWEGNQGLSLSQIGQWNAEQLFAKAYIDQDGDLTVEMMINIRYGVPKETMLNNFEWWRHSLREMDSFI